MRSGRSGPLSGAVFVPGRRLTARAGICYNIKDNFISPPMFRSIGRAAAALSAFFTLACLALFLPLAASATAIAPGDLIKLPDDGKLETTADSAVYYYGADDKRYVFPNSQTYFTWYADFSKVKIVTAAEMAAIPLGGNVTYRPGTRLVKITSDPNVYAVEPGGTLRWIQSEAVAKALYGDNWNKRIDDIPDAYFFNYHIGDPLAAAVYPSGTVVKRSSDGAYFLISDRSKRRIAAADVRSALRIQEPFVITVSGTLSDYPDGADITTVEPGLTDTSQKNLGAVASMPTFTVRLPATNYFAVGADATLMELHLSSVKAVSVTRMTFRLDATTGAPAAGATDIDNGGLIYGNNASPNFTLIRVVDDQGHEPFGHKELALDVSQDQSQTFVFTGALAVAAGQERTLYFRAHASSILPAGEGYKATLVVSGTSVNDAATGAAASFSPAADLAGPVLNSLNASMEISASAKPGLVTYIRGAKNAAIAGLSFKATTVAPNVINSVTFQGYIDEESSGAFLPGADADNGSTTKVSDMLPQVSLYDQQDAKIAGPVNVDFNGKAVFTRLSYHIPAGQTAALIVKGDISQTVDLESQPNRVTFDITDPSEDMSVVDDKGGAVNVIGSLPNGGSTPSFYATVKKEGEVKFSWQGTGGNALVGHEVQLGTLSIETKDDSYVLKTVSFREVGNAAKSLHNARLEYPSGTATASASGTFEGNVAVFSGLAIALPKDKTTQLKLYGGIIPRDAGAVNGELLPVKFGQADALQFVSDSDNSSFTEQDLGSEDFTVGANTASQYNVRFSGLTAAKDPASPAGQLYRDAAVEVLRFTIHAEPEGPVRVRKLTFKIAAGDAGYHETAGNGKDALENWAAVVGDGGDAHNIVNLNQIVGSTKTVLGEDSLTHIRYTVFHGASPVVNPVANHYESAAGDYATIEYQFSEGNELLTGPGGTSTYDLELDTTRFAPDKDYTLGVDLMTSDGFLWTDVPSGSYTALNGSQAAGLPITTSVTIPH